MTRRCFLGSFGASAFAAASKPNIVILLSDDHGYGDLSCYDPHSPDVRTPHIDRIAENGVRFTQGYASAYVCAPTRAAILTGRYQQRFGFYTANDSRIGLPLGETTLAQVLKKEGYATGAFGKWHLGLQPAYHPTRRGFDTFYGFLGHGAHDYFDLKRQPEAYASILRNEEVIDDTGYLTDNLGREASAFITRHAKQPFFLYLAFNAVHFPLQAPAQVIAKYDTGDKKRDTYLAMLERQDAAVGRVLEELRKHNLERNTLIFYLSDNGGAKNNASRNGALRDYKHSVYEGGLRVPFLMSWPARLRQAVSDVPVICMDIFATACAAAGVETSRLKLDGRNLLTLAQGKAAPPHEMLFWDGGEGRRAVRDLRWKLTDNEGRMELFDLESDRSEKRDLATQHPEQVQRLQAALQNWAGGNQPRLKKR